MTLREPSESWLGRNFTRQTVPADMVGVCLAVLASVAVYYVGLEAPIRFLVAVPLLLFFPGYVLVGILFPRGGAVDRSHSNGNGSLATIRHLGRITGPERAALAVGLSVALVPFYGFGLELLPVGAFDSVILPTLVVVVLIGAVVASIRRLRVPAAERFRLPLGAIREAVTAPFGGSMPRGERIATIALAATVLLAVFSVGYVFAVPQDGEQFTDFRVMTETPGGELRLGDYPDRIEVDQTAEFVIGVDNREGSSQEYTVVVTAAQVIEDGGSVTAIESTELGRYQTTLEDGQRLELPQQVTPRSPGAFRLNYYLYEGEPPAEPTADSAYRNAHLTVTASGDGAADVANTTADEFAVDGAIVDDPTVTDVRATDPSVAG